MTTKTLLAVLPLLVQISALPMPYQLRLKRGLLDSDSPLSSLDSNTNGDSDTPLNANALNIGNPNDIAPLGSLSNLDALTNPIQSTPLDTVTNPLSTSTNPSTDSSGALNILNGNPVLGTLTTLGNQLGSSLGIAPTDLTAGLSALLDKTPLAVIFSHTQLLTKDNLICTYVSGKFIDNKIYDLGCACLGKDGLRVDDVAGVNNVLGLSAWAAAQNNGNDGDGVIGGPDGDDEGDGEFACPFGPRKADGSCPILLGLPPNHSADPSNPVNSLDPLDPLDPSVGVTIGTEPPCDDNNDDNGDGLAGPVNPSDPSDPSGSSDPIGGDDGDDDDIPDFVPTSAVLLAHAPSSTAGSGTPTNQAGNVAPTVGSTDDDGNNDGNQDGVPAVMVTSTNTIVVPATAYVQMITVTQTVYATQTVYSAGSGSGGGMCGQSDEIIAAQNIPSNPSTPSAIKSSSATPTPTSSPQMIPTINQVASSIPTSSSFPSASPSATSTSTLQFNVVPTSSPAFVNLVIPSSIPSVSATITPSVNSIPSTAPILSSFSVNVEPSAIPTLAPSTIPDDNSTNTVGDDDEDGDGFFGKGHVLLSQCPRGEKRGKTKCCKESQTEVNGECVCDPGKGLDPILSICVDLCLDALGLQVLCTDLSAAVGLNGVSLHDNTDLGGIANLNTGLDLGLPILSNPSDSSPGNGGLLGSGLLATQTPNETPNQQISNSPIDGGVVNGNGNEGGLFGKGGLLGLGVLKRTLSVDLSTLTGMVHLTRDST
ncbi:hypothetical protein TREMEDRAFT_59556 [Tremella mesenterica DSM 1558]|uniref:uncharacterized protein n=1 Tax=Tremella mesenterica (strain ATCC 24925 / CBS 8224 / DSM 1558 / NBRC 9311 / NRRL Y-6157 / RJB 2259-6 / UBC 559-6) TaxID=578456 RepID=UPI0003F4A3C2|nr:uncharacterized protein TREMEDRAFT_59556 [Tremella mesenterica DSM 1558]EIW73392.1 hypothetical protein TREMEDRAFT_59556 [Tremella mesenterica DSM 1558]